MALKQTKTKVKVAGVIFELYEKSIIAGGGTFYFNRAPVYKDVEQLGKLIEVGREQMRDEIKAALGEFKTLLHIYK